MNKQLFLFDVDGTLVDSTTHIVPDSTKKALFELKQLGHTIGISTGRSLQSLLDGGFDKLAAWDMFLCNNGQAIYDKNKAILKLDCIPKKTVYECLEVAEKQNSPLLIMGENQRLTKQANEHVLTSLDFFKESIPETIPYDGSDVIMMIAFGAMDYDYEAYRKIDGIDVIPGLSTYADIVRKGYHKHIGVTYVLDHFNFTTYTAFGDSLNDMEMIQHATCGIAMGNAHPKLKEIADIVCEDVSNDGIYHALKNLGIL